MLLRNRLLPSLARLVLCLGACAVGLLSLTACSAGTSSHSRDGTVVRVTERDFRITVSPARVRAGDVRVLLRNRGPDAHELIIVKAGGGRLPLRSDDLTVDEETLDPSTAGALEPQAPGTVNTMRLHLRPGRYEMFCNMAGHYLGGMRAQLVVT
jgi:uncharacterized cupredoxin-like copper-binding protein